MLCSSAHVLHASYCSAWLALVRDVLFEDRTLPYSLLWSVVVCAQVVKVAGVALIALFKGKKEKPRS
jgi:hypothetical protein